MSKPLWVVVPAAGVGQRMQAACPKQYLPLLGKTVIEHTLDCFLGQVAIAGIVVVVSQQDSYWPSIAARLSDFPVYTVIGGKERADSVLNGLEYLRSLPAVSADSVVLVHDAARPCLTVADLHLLVAAAESCATRGALLATPVRDTMKRAQPDTEAGVWVSHTEPRSGLWHALTPQLAQLDVLYHALSQALAAGVAITDEASALEWAGLAPRLLAGQAGNIKITHPADLLLAEFFLQQRLAEEEE